MKLLRIAAAIALPVVLALSGCGGSESGTVKLRMVESITSPERTRLIKQLLADFEKQNPDVEVELISPPLEGADQKIQQMLHAKKDLDLLEVRDHTVQAFSNNGWLHALPAEDWPAWADLTDLTKEKATEVGGEAYLIPYGFYEKTLFHRTDWGVPKPPATWQELFDAAKRMTNPNRKRYGLSFRGGKGGYDMAVQMISAYQGDRLNPKDSFFLKDGKTIFSTPEASTALNLYVGLFKEASPPDSVTWGYPEQVQAFTSGVTGMLIQDPEVIKEVEQSSVKGWSTAPIPKGPTGYAFQPVGYAGWGVTSFSSHKTEAVKLVEFLSAAGPSTRFAKENSLIPITRSAQKDPQFSSGAWQAYIEAEKDPKQVITVRPNAYPGWFEFSDVKADKDIQALLAGKKSVADVLRAWDAFWTEQAKKRQ